MLERGESPNLWRPPLYPFMLAGIYGLAGDHHGAVVVVQALLDVLTCWLVFLIGRRIFDERVALVAAGLWGFYPLSTYFTARVMTESLFALLLALSILVLLRAREKPSGPCLLAMGVIQGLTALCKASMLYSAVLMVAYLLAARTARRQIRLRHVALLALGFAVVVAPWTVRNYAVSHRFILISSPGSYAFWSGNFYPTQGRDDDELNAQELQTLEEARTRIARNNPDFMAVENSALFMQDALASIRNHPGQFVWLVFEKFLRFWFAPFHPRTRHFFAAVTLIQLAVLLPAAWGIVLALRRRKAVAPLLLFICYLVPLHALTSATVRYSIPIMPYMILFAVYGVGEAIRPWLAESSIREATG